MNLFDSITKRKSCRSYTNQRMSEKQLDEIKAAIKTFEPLYPDIPLEYRFVTETKGMFHIKTPHYIIVSGQGKEGEQENAGFLFQQLILWFDAHDIGSVWLGLSKDIEKNKKSKDIITIGFGFSDASVHRNIDEFKRKPMDDITNVPENAGIKAVHLAPSGMNLQPWYLELDKEQDRVRIYRQIIKPPLSLMYKLTKIDMGIALCHYAIAQKHFGKPFVFHKQSELTIKKGYELFGYVDV